LTKPSEKPANEGDFKSTWRAFDNWWFGHGSPTTLGVFRIFTGILAFADFWLIGLHWESWFGEKGYVPAWMGQMWLNPNLKLWFTGDATIPRLDLLNGVTDPRVTIPFFIGCMVFAVLTALGIATRFTSICLAIGMISVQHRNAVILHGGDSVVRLACIYTAVAPSGLACSLDRLIGLWKGKISPDPVRISLWPQRLIAFNVALIYFTTIWLKWDGARWREGIATYFPARMAEFYRFPYPRFVNNFPFVYITTYGTLLVEFAMGTLVFFRPLRKYVLPMGIMMHAWIEYAMNIPLFSFLMISSYISFYDGDEIEGWAARVGKRLARRHVTVRYPSGMRLKSSARAFLEAIDPFHLVTYEASASSDWEASSASGPLKPSRAIATRSVGAYIFGWLPGIWPRILGNSLEPAYTGSVFPSEPANKQKSSK